MNLDARKEPAMTDRLRRLLRTVALGLALAGLPLAAPAQLPSSPDLSWLYYEIGGGRGFWPPPNPNQTSVTIGAGAQLGLGYSCATFDPVMSVTNQLNQLRDGIDAMSNQMVAAANAAIAALPAYILQRANPGLYDLFQNALLRAEETFSLATKTCEQMEAEIARGHDPFHEWVVLSKGHGWRRAMGTGGVHGDGDIVATKQHIEEEAGRGGVPWLGGGRQGGAGQEPIRTVADVVRAGYNVTAQRPPAALGPAFAAGDPTAPPMARHWTSPEAAANWAVQVLGDENIATCFEADCPERRSTPGMGLTRQVESEREVLLPELVDLIGGATPLTAASLERFSAGGVSVTPALVRAIRELPPAERGIAVGASERRTRRRRERRARAVPAAVPSRRPPGPRDQRRGTRHPDRAGEGRRAGARDRSHAVRVADPPRAGLRHLAGAARRRSRPARTRDRDRARRAARGVPARGRGGALPMTAGALSGVLSGLKGLFLLFAGVVVLAAAGLLLWGQFESMETIGSRLQTAAPWLTVWRIAAIVALIAAWPRIVPWMTANPAAREALLAARWRVAAWLAILELVLGQGLVTAFVAGLGG
jgi:integrating conjugative element protein (TIGR03755 family)